MSQSLSNQRPVGHENVIPIKPFHLMSGDNRFEMIPGRVGHFLESGYSFGEAVAMTPKRPQLDLDHYHIILIPKDVAQNPSSHPVVPLGTDPGMLILSRDELVSRVQSGSDFPADSAKLNSDYAAFGDIQVDFRSIEVRRSNRPVRLSAMEFKVLKFFLAHPNRVISRDELLNEVWGYNNYPCTRTVDNHVLRLRHKLEPDFSNPIYFRTAPGFGYRFIPVSDDLEKCQRDSSRISLTKRRDQ